MAKILGKLNSFIDSEKQPKSLNLGKVLMNVFLKHDYHALGDFHKNSLFVGMMHFQDLYNWDINRIKKCDIHYTTPEGIIPFCTFNVIPQWYRDKIQKAHAISITEWQKRNAHTLAEAKYKRNIKELELTEAYKRTYGTFEVRGKRTPVAGTSFAQPTSSGGIKVIQMNGGTSKLQILNNAEGEGKGGCGSGSCGCGH